MRAREMCVCFGATSVNTILDAVASPAQAFAVCRRLFSPTSGKRRSQSIALGIPAKILSHVRNVVGSI